MNRASWRRIRELYVAALELPEERRQEFLEQHCGADEDLFREIHELLTALPPLGFVEPPDQVGLGMGLEGRALGDFVLVREIGYGGMGVVYEADQQGLGRRVAVKVLPLLPRDSRSLDRFRREVLAASALDHPWIVPILAHGQEENLAWYSMRLVVGHDLAEEIRRQREPCDTSRLRLLPPFAKPEYLRCVASRIADLADALGAAHEHGVIHRDVKPQNILLDDKGQAFLADFGLARDERFGSLTATGVVQGTPHYMSPEQARALRSTVDHRTDVYSLSVVLYELLTLRRPFDGRSSQEVINKIGHSDPRTVRHHNSQVPRDLAVICEKGMSRNPDRRYPRAPELAADLRRFLAYRAIKGRPPSALERITDRLRHHRRLLTAASAALLALIAGFLWARVAASRSALAQDLAQLQGLLEEQDWSSRTGDLVAARHTVLRLEGQPSLPGNLEQVLGNFRGRMTRDREQRRRQAGERLQLGLGGLPIEGSHGAFLTPGSAPHLLQALALYRDAATVHPDDRDFQRFSDVRSLYPGISITLQREAQIAQRSDEAYATLTPFDPIRDRMDDHNSLSLGLLPVQARRVPPGYYRILIVIPGYGHAELTRQLEIGGEVLDLTVPVVPTPAAREGMKFISAQSAPACATDIGCLWTDTDLTVDDFWIDEMEVSNGQYLAFLRDTGRQAPKFWRDAGYPSGADVDHETAWLYLPVEPGDRWHDLPVVGPTWAEAVAYAEWAGKRLPTHSELELAARGSRMYLVPSSGLSNTLGARDGVDDEHHPLRAIYAHYVRSVQPVDDEAYRQGPEQLYHIFGNVSEWSESMFVEPRGSRLESVTWMRLHLGGAWYARSAGTDLSTHAAWGTTPAYLTDTVGFRCAKSVIDDF